MGRERVGKSRNEEGERVRDEEGKEGRGNE